MTRPHLRSHLPDHRSLTVLEMNGPGSPPDGPVIHPHATLTVLTAGQATVSCGSTYAIGPGDVLLVPEGMPHFGTAAEDTRGIGLALCTACLTSPAGARLAALFADVSTGGSPQRTLDPADAARLVWIFEALRDELTAERPWRALAVEGHLALIGALVSRATPAARLIDGRAPEASVSARALAFITEHAHRGISLAVEGHLALIGALVSRATPAARLVDGRAPEASVSARALAFITENAHRGISLADVARHVHRSVAHTAAVVKAETGRTVVGWITHARMATARQLLLRTDDTIEAVADRVGFASPSHFHRTFRRHHQITPAGWRAAHRRPAPG